VTCHLHEINRAPPTVTPVPRPILSAAALAVLLTACASSGGVGTTSLPDDPTTSVSSGSASTEAPTTTAVVPAPETTSGRPVAPDFTLPLGDGGTFTLSQGAKPVYLVFWAEW